MFEGVFAQLSPLEPWWPWIAAALGAIVGSFLNVVILRLPLRLEWSCGSRRGNSSASRRRTLRRHRPDWSWTTRDVRPARRRSAPGRTFR